MNDLKDEIRDYVTKINKLESQVGETEMIIAKAAEKSELSAKTKLNEKDADIKKLQGK